MVRIESARCGAVPAIAFELDGVLGSGSSDATVSMQGRVSLEGKKPPENQAWGDYNAMKILAQAMAETSAIESDPLVGHLDKGATFDVMKEREGYFRDWDHQLIMEMYTMTPKPPEQITDQWDIMAIGEAVPAADQPLDTIAPTREENACTFA